MNDLKTDDKVMIKKIKTYISVHVMRLMTAYEQDFDDNSILDFVNFVMNELKQKAKLNEKILKDVYDELLCNYTFYRKINKATYMTAYTNVIKK